MKRMLICWFFIIVGKSAFAQQKDSTTVSIDTINITGIVYVADGVPAKHMEIRNEWWINLPGYRMHTKTDTNGYFELKGVNPNDKLHFTDGKYSDASFPVKGSRFIVIYLPSPKVIAINQGDSIIVKAPRKHPKIKPTVRVANKNDVVWSVNGQYPEYKGGQEKLINFIRQNLIYPDKAIENNIEGTVEIAFTVKWDGTQSDFKVLKGIGYGCDEEIITLLKETPKWKPGINDGRPFSIQETISVKFSLTDN